MKANEIWVLCRYRQGQLTTCSRELIGAAKQLARQEPKLHCAAVIFAGEGPADATGLDKVYMLKGGSPEADGQGRLLAEAIRQYQPEILLAEATGKGRSICSVAAPLVGTGMTADCIDLALDANGMLISTRPALGGNVIAEIICPEKRPQITTVRPGSFKPDTAGGAEPEIVEYQAQTTFRGAALLESYAAGGDRVSLAESRILIAGGLGLGSALAFRKLEKLAGSIGAGVVASRGAVNAGYAPYRCQVGLSGMSVRPELYIALGISGAAQHLAGIRQAKKIIAVNTDPKAPIFQYADVGIVADWESYVDKLTQVYSGNFAPEG